MKMQKKKFDQTQKTIMSRVKEVQKNINLQTVFQDCIDTVKENIYVGDGGKISLKQGMMSIDQVPDYPRSSHFTKQEKIQILMAFVANEHCIGLVAKELLKRPTQELPDLNQQNQNSTIAAHISYHQRAMEL